MPRRKQTARISKALHEQHGACDALHEQHEACEALLQDFAHLGNRAHEHLIPTERRRCQDRRVARWLQWSRNRDCSLHHWPWLSDYWCVTNRHRADCELTGLDPVAHTLKKFALTLFERDPAGLNHEDNVDEYSSYSTSFLCRVTLAVVDGELATQLLARYSDQRPSCLTQNHRGWRVLRGAILETLLTVPSLRGRVAACLTDTANHEWMFTSIRQDIIENMLCWLNPLCLEDCGFAHLGELLASWPVVLVNVNHGADWLTFSTLGGDTLFTSIANEAPCDAVARACHLYAEEVGDEGNGVLSEGTSWFWESL